jgi:hypothetical protein
MKKLLLVLAIGAFAACNDSATSTDSAGDSVSTSTTIDVQPSGDSAGVTGSDTTTLRTDSLGADTAR